MDSTNDMLLDDGLEGWTSMTLSADAGTHNRIFAYQYGDVTYNATTGALDFSVINSDSAGAFAQTNPNLKTPAGDFDIRMDYNITHFTIPLYAGTYTRLSTRIYDAALGGNIQSVYIGMQERYESPQRSFRAYTTDSSESGCTYVARPSDCLTTGKIRYIRRGTTTTVYYLSGGVWYSLASKLSCTTTPWTINLSAAQFTAVDTSTSSLSNMIVMQKAVPEADIVLGTCLLPQTLPLDLPNYLYDASNATYGTATSDGTSITVTRNATSADSSGGEVRMSAQYRVCGDFDVTVDYNLTAFPTPASGVAWFALKTHDPLASGDTQNISIERYATTAGQKLKGWDTNSSDAASTIVSCPSDCLTTGKFRVTRVSTTVTVYYWTAGAWVQLRQKTGANTERWDFRMYIGKSTGSALYSGIISNVVVH